ncbi:MAG: hypothetical protein C4527_11875 [Candidatus Omnitrophota bacterium]|jgi:hypothetical protein|nr:MAG: hypothetical protein C4527_11875 [Candidatus Omnitrophota bacterium]
MERTQSRSRETGRVIFLLAVAIVMFWWRAWIPSPMDRMHFTDDIFVKDYPTRLGLYRVLASGHLPLWDPYQFAGWPGIANCEAGFFYPLNLILMPFVYSPQAAFSATEWLVLLHFLIAGLGAYRLARYAGLSTYGAGLAAVAFAFCGFHCAHKKHTNMLFTLVWFPWILLQIERWIREKLPRYLVRGALVLALAYLAGHPQASLYITIVIFARFLYAALAPAAGEHETAKREIARRCAPVLFIIVMAFALTAVQWLPSWELIQEGERASVDQFQRSTEFSLPTFELIDAFMPEALRSWSQVEVFYWGIIPLVLALLTVVQGNLDALQRFLVATAILSVLLAMGEYIFVYDLSYVLIPGIAWVRAPSRWIYFASLPIAMLAGKGVDILLSDPAFLRDKESSQVFLRIILVMTGILGLFLYFIFLVAGTEDRYDLLRAMILLVMFAGTFLILIVLTQQKKISPNLTAFLAILLTWMDLGTHYRTIDMAPGVGGYELNETVDKINRLPEHSRSKIYIKAGGNRTLYHGGAQNFRELDGQSPLTPRLHLQLRKDTALDFPEKPNLSLLQLCNVSSIICDATAYTAYPYEMPRETNDLVLMNSPGVRARLLPETIHVQVTDQRALLSLQAFPFHRVGLIENPAEENEERTSRPSRSVFPKPFLLVSASNEAVKSAAHLIVDGKDHFAGLGEEPGYYFAVADAETGKIEKTEMFNLMKSYDEGGRRELETMEERRTFHPRMIQFMAQIPEGKIVFAAIKDNATNVLMPEGLAALQSIGAALDVRAENFYRYAHAIVGKKGAALGTALEIISPTEALVLQTDQTMYVHGTVMGLPKPEWHATKENADQWYDLFKRLSRTELPQQRFRRDHLAAADYFPLPYPIVVYSVPKKTLFSPITDQASILAGGKEISPNKPGYNLLVLDPDTGRVEASDCFNTVLDYDPVKGDFKDLPLENIRMQNFIRSATDGYVVVGAIRDEATNLLQKDTVEVMQNELGSEFQYYETTEMRYRLSHAFVAVKGARHCIEAFEKEQNAIVYTRWPGGPSLTRADRTMSDGKVKEVQYAIPQPMEELILGAADISWNVKRSAGTVWIVEENGPNQLRISGTSETGGALFLSEMMFPGWTAWLDGVPTPIERIFYYFRCVKTPAGAHEIKMTYFPHSFYMGMWISIASLVLIIFLSLSMWKRKKD